MSINDLSFCDHGYTKIKICPSCLREKDDQIDSLKSLLRSAHYLLQDCPGETWESEFQKWLTAYSSLTSSKSGLGE